MTTQAARDILKDLNEEQRCAVEAVKGPVLIVAGPGSGKTRVITHRIAYLVRVLNVDPRRILAVTFTNKAAREMRHRMTDLLGERANHVTMGTFHALGARVLREHGEAVGVAKEFVIYDEDDQRNVMRRVMEAEGLDPKNYNIGVIHNAISGAKNRMLTVADHAKQCDNHFDRIVNRCYDRYQALLQAAHAVDFDDLLMRPVLLLKSNPEILKRYQNRYLHSLVDEWQDTNQAQYALTNLIASEHRNLCVVGDPDQSIYSWRHADIRNILDFERDYPDAQMIPLGRNYRSTKTIVDAAHAVIKTNESRKDVELWTEKGDGHKLVVHRADDDALEALYLASEIERLRDSEGIRYGDIAVMYRTNAQSRGPEDAFVRAGIRYRIVGGLRFWERREIRDVMSYMKVIHNPYDDISLQRIVNAPTRGIGKRTIDSLVAWATERDLPLYAAMQAAATPPEDGGLTRDALDTPTIPPKTLSALRAFVEMMSELSRQSQTMDVLAFFQEVLEKTGYLEYMEKDDEREDRLDNLDELRSVAGEYEELPAGDGFAAFLDQAALSTDLDAAKREEGVGVDAVTMISLHQAKGLEFPAVFIIGMEEDLLPHFRSIESGDSAEIEEERRLCYVGMTRAKDRLYLTHAARRNTRGRYAQKEPSRFLKDVPSGLIMAQKQERLPTVGPVEPMPTQKHMGPVPPAPYRPGDHVGHTTFGQGVVIACLATAAQDDFEVTVAFRDQGVKRLLAGIAALEKLD